MERGLTTLKAFIILNIVIIIAIIGVFTYFYFFKAHNVNISNNIVPVFYTKDNLDKELVKQQLIQDLPGDALISLKLYNTSNGQRFDENSYSIKQGKVEKENLENPDLEIDIDSKYLSQLGGDFCGTVKMAKNNGDLIIKNNLGKVSFAWKYKSILRYKDCFGF